MVLFIPFLLQIESTRILVSSCYLMISKFHIHHFLISYYRFHIFPMLCFLTTLDLGQCIIDKTTPYLEHKKINSSHHAMVFGPFEHIC
jgi:hypothetical protein